MKIAVASGKGGTGKTTVATNLAYAASGRGRAVTYLDCDVEEPNGHIFLKPKITSRRSVGTPIPQVDSDSCTHCGQCGQICQYSGIVCIGQTVLTYPQLCHSCGGCAMVCPAGAISEVSQDRGVVEVGSAGSIRFVRGVLNVGQAKSPPVIRAVRSVETDSDLVIVDAPPGTSCPVIESIRGVDYVLLVTEATPFGLWDLKLAVAMVHALTLACGVVINRCDLGDGETVRYCRKQGLDVLAELPDDRRVAEAYSRGLLASEAGSQYATWFEKLFERIVEGRTGGRCE